MRAGHSFESIMTHPRFAPLNRPKSDYPMAQRANGTDIFDNDPQRVDAVVMAAGETLPADIRSQMEVGFGQDFSDVRVHSDALSAQSAASLGAIAYTLGHHVVFSAEAYSPSTTDGVRLLAHELTHVVQQRSGAVAGVPIGWGLSVSEPDDEFERAARDRAARFPTDVPAQPRVPPLAGSDGGHDIQRQLTKPAGLILQRKPDDASKGVGDLELPWKHGDYSLFEETSAGIRFLVGVSGDKEGEIRREIPAISKQMSADNSRIDDPASRVMVCFVVSTTTRFALWQGIPALMLDLPDANVEAAAHEMGHAIFYFLEGRAKSPEKGAAKADNLRLLVADIYVRLSQTKAFTEGSETHAAGLWIADPSQWGSGGAAEHPWRDPDEFFASAKEGFQLHRKGFENAIDRFKKFDPAVGKPAKELLALLDAFLAKGRLPSKALPEAPAAAAKAELERATGVSKVEAVMPDTLLDWLLNPGNRPKHQKARPSIESPY